MTTALYKCCFCLNTVQNPIVMCHQTHVGCFDCVCRHVRHSETSDCALCRQPLQVRFDRLITESAAALQRPKKRRKRQQTPTIDSYTVFLRLLDLKNKDKFRLFTRTLKRFSMATELPESILQLAEDIENILKARKSTERLHKQKLYDPSIHPINYS